MSNVSLIRREAPKTVLESLTSKQLRDNLWSHSISYTDDGAMIVSLSLLVEPQSKDLKAIRDFLVETGLDIS